MRAPATRFSTFVLAAFLLVAACNRRPETTPEGALAALQRSLANGYANIDRVADTLVYNQAGFLLQSQYLEARSQLHLSPTAVNDALAEMRERGRPERFFAGVRTLLRQGHCQRIADADLPDNFQHAPQPNDGWPANARTLQRSVARRMQNLVSGDYRCDGGPSFSAFFTRPEPDDGTLRVAFIGPSTHP